MTSIGNNAFDYCSGLKKVIVQDIAAWYGISFGNIYANPLNYAHHLYSDETAEITDLIIPNSVTSIGDYAFFDCNGLTSVTIPGSVTSIGEGAFSHCSGLTSINIPNSVTSIGSSAFSGCSGLTSITIGSGVTSIGNNAFNDCSGLKKVIVQDIAAWCGISFGGYRANPLNYAHHLYSDETAEITDLIIPNSVTSIGDYAFSGCSGLTSVTIPNSVTSIGDYAFSDCSGLKKVIVSDIAAWCGISFGSNPLSLAQHLYSNEETEITELVIPEGVTSIGDYAFYDCSGLTSITIPNSVSSIGDYAFYDCSGLTSITIPNSVSSIGRYAFSDCSGLTSVTIGSGVTYIGIYAFSDCSGLTSITIPENVTLIGYAAFLGCFFTTNSFINNSSLTDSNYWGATLYDGEETNDGLLIIDNIVVKCRPWVTSVNIPNNVSSIGERAFQDCTSLTSVTIPNSVTSIGSYAFQDCTSLKKVIVQDIAAWYGISFGNINANPLRYAHHLYSDEETEITDLVIPDGVTAISDWAFYNCYGLTSVTIPNSVTSIGDYAFYYCSGLTSVTIGSGVTSIGNYAFNYCSGLTSVTLDNDAIVSANRFNNSMKYIFGDQVKKYVIGNSVKSIGDYAFFDCNGLTSVTIPGSVTSIGSSAFSGCSGLTSINSYIEEPFAINYVFDGNTFNTATLFVPVGTIEAYQSTNGWKNFKNIIEESGSSIVLSVIDENDADVTDNVNIVWYNAEGMEIGMGNKLNGIVDSTEVYYSVLLDETMGRIYREVKMQKVIANGAPVTCQLEKIRLVQLVGRVSATDIDKTTATVNVKQMLNGKWEQTYTTQTDEQGVFKVEVYDDETDITISGEGYLDATLHRERFGESGNVGTIPLNLISGFSIAATITMQKAVASGETEEVTAWAEGLNNIEFTITNMSKSSAITDFTVQNGNVIIKTGADVGDEINLTAKSKQGIFSDAITAFVITDGANAFDLKLTELGGIDATCTSSSNGVTVGYLYDSNGLLTAKGTYTGETLSMRHLPSGTYTLITMGSSMLLHNITHLANIFSVGLSEGTDYVATNVEIIDGKLTEVAVNEVPQLDDTRFYYTSGDTYFNVNKPSVTAGNYLTLQAHVDFKAEYADKADDMTLTIDLPEGCQMVENSVIANSQAVAHTVNGSRVTIPLTKEQYESQIRFCVIPTLNQSYTITAMASFDVDGQVTQPIGSVQFEAKGLSLSAPEKVVNTNITINGTAKGRSNVSIYDNDVLIGKTTSKADGSWTAECELFKPYSYSFHDIYARITTENGMELTSEVQQVEYDKNGNVPEKVMMLYRNSVINFDLLKETTSPTFYSFVPGDGSFTFLADFTRNDSTQIKNVNIKVLNNDGTVRTLPATFDGKQNKWVATTNYESSNRLPTNVKVEYGCIPNKVTIDSLRIKDDNQQYLNLVKNYVTNIDPAKCEVFNANESVMISKYQTHTLNTPVYIRIEKLNYEKWITDLEKFNYFTFENDGITTYVCDSIINESYHIDWYWKKEEKELLQVELFDSVYFHSFVNIKNTRKPVRKQDSATSTIVGNLGNIIGNSLLNLFCNAGDIRNIINDYETGYNDLQNWWNQYSITQDNHFQLYNNTKELLNTKCPDGSSKLSGTNYSMFSSSMNDCFEEANEMREQFKDNLDKMEQDLVRRRDAATMFSATEKFINVAEGLVSGGATTFCEFAKDFVEGQAANDLWNRLLQNEFFTSEKMSDWYYPENAKIIEHYSNLMDNIKSAYRKCKEKDDDDEKDDDFKNKGTTPQIDPSGYVYEAVESNRLEDVTVTCYQKVQKEDMYGDITEEAAVWNAEDYSQQNPLKTDETGFYRWDVPQGMWQVKYEKEGYETTYSDWLPVPPPQLDVNISMKQTTPPSVKQMYGYESGITIELSKYMLPETMTTERITVTRNGKAEKGTIELLNAEKAPKGGETYVSKVKFVPNNRFNTSDIVVVTVHKEVESYCGVKMTADHVETVTIESEIEKIVIENPVKVPYNSAKTIIVEVLPADASAGKTLNVKTSSTMILSVEKESYIIDEEGKAEIILTGELPGTAALTFSVEGTDKEALTIVNVAQIEPVATPIASIASWSIVEKGTQVLLSCATEGATIYYTLDGSCPCVSGDARMVYDGTPITIEKNTVIKAMAAAPDMEESEVATFVYIVTNGDLNGDGKVDIADGVTVLNIMAEGKYEEFADVNHDQKVDIADFVTILNIMAAIENLKPLPHERGEKCERWGTIKQPFVDYLQGVFDW